MGSGQDWASEKISTSDGRKPVTPNLAHRIAVLERELRAERRATQSAIELLRVVSDAYQTARVIPHPLAGRELWISHDLWISISTVVAMYGDYSHQEGKGKSSNGGNGNHVCGEREGR